MIPEFVAKFDAARPALLELFKKTHPEGYEGIVRAVVEALNEPGGYVTPDPKRIHRIDDGDYQGTLLFLVAAEGYQPSTYWAVKVGYGSCSGCDTFESIREYGDAPPTDEQAKEYFTLALHVVQGLREVCGASEAA